MNDQMNGMQAIIHNISPTYMDNYMNVEINAFTKTICRWNMYYTV